MKPTLAGSLGLVHRVIGMAHQEIWIGIITRKQGDTDTSGYRHLLPLQVERHGDSGQHPLQHGHALLLQRQITQQQNKLIPTKPGYRITDP